MKKLSLKNLNQEYNFVKGFSHELYYNEKVNNLIIFNPLAEKITSEEVYNGTSENAYLHLISELNNKNGLVISWSKVEGTTSDYTIYHDLSPNELLKISTDKIFKELKNSIKSERLPSSKYTQVIEGEEKKIELPEIEDELATYFHTMTSGEFRMLTMRSIEFDIVEIDYCIKLKTGSLKGKMFIPREVIYGKFDELGEIVIKQLSKEFKDIINPGDLLQ
ncbi:hypothetical protein [Metabacillus arenae]|uniref:Uncharacterized protein n=1 Tax=Metabacillus arenae TaxID=2771434 RepID=A0A926RUX5_9BACI|nr:hypothetical protein [Metabacillus arenae]MBD1379053.1 hypothetical protein [Metabacillus arenae]